MELDIAAMALTAHHIKNKAEKQITNATDSSRGGEIDHLQAGKLIQEETQVRDAAAAYERAFAHPVFRN